MSRSKRVEQFLQSECEYSADGHQMGFVDSWPDREYNTGRNIWMHKYYCQFCLKVIVAESSTGKPA